jgi:adenylate cyclase
VVVKGKTKPVAIYEILDYHTDASYPQMTDALRLFKAGLMKYRKQEWPAAIAEFSEVLSLNDHDKSAKLYIERCKHFIANPPGAEWDGVWVMESK